MKLLQGKKVKLRAVEPEDIDLLMEWENHTPFWEITCTLAPFSRATLRKYIKNANLDIYQTGQLRFMIDCTEDGHTIGTVDLFEFDPFHRRAGIGILIADEQRRNNGYAGESLALLKQYSFQYLGLHQLFCNILKDNKPSLHLFEKAGFEISGSMLQWVRVGSEYKDQYFLQAFNDE